MRGFYGAVMAHAGVYLMLRAGPIVVESDVTMVAMIVVGGATLIYATAVKVANLDHMPARDNKGPRKGKGAAGTIEK